LVSIAGSTAPTAADSAVIGGSGGKDPLSLGGRNSIGGSSLGPAGPHNSRKREAK